MNRSLKSTAIKQFRGFLSHALVTLTFYGPMGAFAAQCETDLNTQHTRTANRIKHSNFTTDRTLKAYAEHLKINSKATFAEILRDLPQGSTWLDLGAGQAFAQRDMLRNQLFHNVENLVALSFDAPRSDEFLADKVAFRERFHFVETGLLENALVDPNHAVHAWKGQVDLLTEVWGPTAYVKDLQEVLIFIAQLLKPKGQALIQLSALHTRFLIDGRKVGFEELLRHIGALTGGAIELVALGKDHTFAGHLRRTDIVTPSKPTLCLRTLEFHDGAPPERLYAVGPCEN